MKAEDAEELMGLVNKNEEAKVEINIMMETPKWVNTHQTPYTCTHKHTNLERMQRVLILRPVSCPLL